MLAEDFDPIKYEIEREEIYLRSLATFSDGDFDARIGYEPSEESWRSENYREGYLFGIEQRLNEKYLTID